MSKPAHRSLSKFFVLAGVLVVICAFVRLFLWGEIRASWYRDYTEVRVVNDSDWFDYPVGAPNARGYYRAQKFGEGDRLHLGEDWNGMGGGNSDYGDPVYAIADGIVTYSDNTGGGWGNIVRIVHPVIGKKSVEAVYAHLAALKVNRGDRIRRGEVIGAIGDAYGYYKAHLHFEIRDKVGMPLGAGYGNDAKGIYCDPSEFIDKHRKKS